MSYVKGIGKIRDILVRSFLSVKGRKFKVLEKVYKKEEVRVFLSNLTKNWKEVKLCSCGYHCI